MNIDNFYLVFERYYKRIFNICSKYRYQDNISHLFSIIIPLFIIKYGTKKDRLILDVFDSVPIIINDKQDKVHQAFYTNIPFKVNNEINTKKFIVLSNYKDISLLQLLDNLIHEYNHAINSWEKGMMIRNNILFLRCGLTFSRYDYLSLKPLDKDKSFVLEEILNTYQTEDMINLIREIDIDKICNLSLKNTVSSIQRDISSYYCSYSYYYQRGICKILLDNRTFTSTLNALRISGDIVDIDSWFDNITNIKNSYNNLVSLLEEILLLESKLKDLKFKYFTLNKIKNNTSKLIYITHIFNQNCTYK